MKNPQGWFSMPGLQNGGMPFLAGRVCRLAAQLRCLDAADREGMGDFAGFHPIGLIYFRMCWHLYSGGFWRVV